MTAGSDAGGEGTGSDAITARGAAGGSFTASVGAGTAVGGEGVTAMGGRIEAGVVGASAGVIGVGACMVGVDGMMRAPELSFCACRSCGGAMSVFGSPRSDQIAITLTSAASEAAMARPQTGGRRRSCGRAAVDGIVAKTSGASLRRRAASDLRSASRMIDMA